MTFTQINIEKSKRTGKLVTVEHSVLQIIDQIFVPILILPILLMACTDIYYDLQRNEPLGKAPYILAIGILFFIYTIFRATKINDLKRISGISERVNSDLIHSIAKEFDWKIRLENERVTVIDIHWEQNRYYICKQITIIYDRKDLLVNCKAFLIFKLTSPFHLISNRRKIKALERNFNEKIKSDLQRKNQSLREVSRRPG